MLLIIELALRQHATGVHDLRRLAKRSRSHTILEITAGICPRKGWMNRRDEEYEAVPKPLALAPRLTDLPDFVRNNGIPLLPVGYSIGPQAKSYRLAAELTAIR